MRLIRRSGNVRSGIFYQRKRSDAPTQNRRRTDAKFRRTDANQRTSNAHPTHPDMNFGTV